MRYFVSVKVDSRIDVEVEAGNFKEARQMAELRAGDQDLNRVTYVEFEAVNATDENGKFADY